MCGIPLGNAKLRRDECLTFVRFAFPRLFSSHMLLIFFVRGINANCCKAPLALFLWLLRATLQPHIIHSCKVSESSRESCREKKSYQSRNRSRHLITNMKIITAGMWFRLQGCNFGLLDYEKAGLACACALRRAQVPNASNFSSLELALTRERERPPRCSGIVAEVCRLSFSNFRLYFDADLMRSK